MVSKSKRSLKTSILISFSYVLQDNKKVWFICYKFFPNGFTTFKRHMKKEANDKLSLCKKYMRDARIN